MQDQRTRRAISSMGSVISPDTLHAVHSLYDAEQRVIAAAMPPLACDIAYGPHARHRLDVYAPARREGRLPVLIWVHGGGFRRGSKGGGDVWQDANAGRMAAQEGMLGVVINYRLSPEFTWPSGNEDLAFVVDWARREAVSLGGDPDRVFLAGSSAGGAHVAGYLKHRGHSRDIAGAIMLSGLYGVTPLEDERDRSYFGEDAAKHAAMIPLDAVGETRIPLLIACAEFDPARFQQEFLGALQRRLSRHGTFTRACIASGHNHFSLAYHLGTADRRVASEIASFVADAPGT